MTQAEQGPLPEQAQRPLPEPQPQLVRTPTKAAALQREFCHKAAEVPASTCALLTRARDLEVRRDMSVMKSPGKVTKSPAKVLSCCRCTCCRHFDGNLRFATCELNAVVLGLQRESAEKARTGQGHAQRIFQAGQG